MMHVCRICGKGPTDATFAAPDDVVCFRCTRMSDHDQAVLRRKTIEGLKKQIADDNARLVALLMPDARNVPQ